MPFVAGPHANDLRAVGQHRLAREAGEEIDAGGLDLLGQPLGELVERDDVVAVVAERRRRNRQPNLPSRREVVDVVLVHLGFERRALRLEVGNELAER